VNAKIISRIKRIFVALLLIVGSLGFFDIARYWVEGSVEIAIYFILAILFFLSAVGLLIFSSKASYIFTGIVSSLYIAFFLITFSVILAIDRTGQGLVGLLFLVPQVGAAIVAILFSHFECKKIRKANVSKVG